MALGEGRMLESGDRADFSVSTGDRVLFSAYAGTEVKYDGEEYLVMGEDDILGVIS